MAPGAGRVEPNQRKRAGIRLRQAASAKATPKAFASEAARQEANPNVFASEAVQHRGIMSKIVKGVVETRSLK
ncbi:MAG: hypothetical protein DMF23_05145 [Verrucomicrobia bacterium]|nr:MAG: hypothetical protein DMF23_05145 [Verrucomicrobiota bacterium]